MIAVAVGAGGIAQTVVVQPGVSLGLSCGLGISGPFAVITVGWVAVVMVGVWVVASIASVASIAEAEAMIAIAVVVTSIAQTVVVQPWVGLGVSLSISLGSGLSLSLLYRHHSLLLSLGRGGGNGEGSEGGENSVSTGNHGTVIVPTAGRSVDQGDVVVGQWEVVVPQGMPNGVGKLGVSLSRDVGSDS